MPADVDDYNNHVTVPPSYPDFIQNSIESDTEIFSDFPLFNHLSDVDVDIDTNFDPLLEFTDPIQSRWEVSEFGLTDSLFHNDSAGETTMIDIAPIKQKPSLELNDGTLSKDRLTNFFEHWIELEQLALRKDIVALEKEKVQQRIEEVRSRSEQKRRHLRQKMEMEKRNKLRLQQEFEGTNSSILSLT